MEKLRIGCTIKLKGNQDTYNNPLSSKSYTSTIYSTSENIIVISKSIDLGNSSEEQYLLIMH